MDYESKNLTSSSSAVLMSLLSEQILCSWPPTSDKENGDISNMPAMMALVPGIKDKPPIYKKYDTTENETKIPPELNLELYTIRESSSEESSERLKAEDDLHVEDMEDVDLAERQTDLILQDLQKEQDQLIEIVNDIDRLFEGDKSGPSGEVTDGELNVDEDSKVGFKRECDGVSTYGDIVSILEQLERDEARIGSGFVSKPDSAPGRIQQIISDHSPRRESRKPDTPANDTCKEYEKLLSYLDQIDESSVKTLTAAKERVRHVTELAESHTHLDIIPKLDDLLRHTNVELANYIIALTIRLEEKTSSVDLLRNEMCKSRRAMEEKDEGQERVIKQRLVAEKNKYEPVIRRHQTFIDQLIADKKELNVKCETLMLELKSLENRHAHNVQAAEQRHRIELRRCRDTHEAAEKVKREKWMEAKTAKIKEMTIKSVEHDIVSMTEKYERETSELRASHKREIEELELRAARKTQQQCEQLRAQLTAEREAAIAGEREALRQRFERLVESEEKGRQEQVRRAREEHSARLAELDQRERTLAEEKDNAVKLMKEECEERLETAQRRHDVQMNNVKESCRLELEMWKSNYVKQQSLRLTDTESRIREACRRERDREIELVIDRLEREGEEMKQRSDHTTNNKLRRLKERYEEELRALRKSEEDQKTRCAQLSKEITSQEAAITRLHKTNTELQQERSNLQKISDSLSAEKKNLREVIREEFGRELEEARGEVAAARGRRERELQDIYTRVRVSMARKDEELQKMSEDNLALHDKCRLLEKMLEQQRRDYLIR